MTISKSITDLIGNTPIIPLSFFSEKCYGNIYAKLESKNPGGSVKDRLAFALIEDGEKKNLIDRNTVIIEASSGNTGIGLAMICAARKYHLILVMPESASLERRKILSAYGAELVLTDAKDGMAGAVEKSRELNKTIKASYLTRQFDNPANPKKHKETTAVEIWNDMQGKVDILICGTGTGGTLTGVGEFLKEKSNNIKVYAIEPENSPVLSGGKSALHRIQGIGPEFIPSVLNTKIIDEIIQIKDSDAIDMALRLVKNGIFAGISSGANVLGAMTIAQRQENKDKNIITFICDSGERYLSTNIY